MGRSLASYERELISRGAAERTRRAYRNDLVQFAGWAMERGHRTPDQVEHRDVRLFAARLSESGAAAATGRPQAGVGARLLRPSRAQRQLGQNPADLVGSPKRASKLPKVLSPEQMAELLDRIPAHTPLEVRDRAMFEARLFVWPALRGDHGGSIWDAIRLRDEQDPGCAARVARSASCGRRARPARAAAISGDPPARPFSSAPPRRRRCCSPGAGAGSRRLTSAGGLRRWVRGRRDWRRISPHSAAPRLRHPSARGRR